MTRRRSDLQRRRSTSGVVERPNRGSTPPAAPRPRQARAPASDQRRYSGHREHQLGGRTLDEPREQHVRAPRAAQERRNAGGHHLGEDRGARLADDQRREDGRHEPHRRTASRAASGRPQVSRRDALQTRFHAQNTTPKTTPMTRRRRGCRASATGPRRGGAAGLDRRWSRAVPPGTETPSSGRRTARVEPGPASFAGTSRIRFRGSVVGPHSQRVCAPRRRSSVAGMVPQRLSRPLPRDSPRAPRWLRGSAGACG